MHAAKTISFPRKKAVRCYFRRFVNWCRVTIRCNFENFKCKTGIGANKYDVQLGRVERRREEELKKKKKKMIVEEHHLDGFHGIYRGECFARFNNRKQ